MRESRRRGSFSGANTNQESRPADELHVSKPGRKPVVDLELADFRRSGSVEALAGDVPPETLSTKMANTISASNRLHKTYAPAVLASVRNVDAARGRGRSKLREQKR